MPIGMHIYTCMGCGSQEICGDCIPEFCPSCQERYDKNHPTGDCPCGNCQHRIVEQRIAAKIGAEAYAAITAEAALRHAEEMAALYPDRPSLALAAASHRRYLDRLRDEARGTDADLR